MKYAIALSCFIAAASLPLLTAAQSASPTETVACESRTARTLGGGKFTKKRYSIHGEWSLGADCTSKTLGFSDDFKTKGGPDLKVYLSKRAISDLDNKTADQDTIKLGVLKSNKGAQSYIIPANVDLSEYKSVVIHCEAFSVLWGGFDLPE